MYNAQKPLPSDLPSNAKLARSTILAAGVAGALLATIVLPAEYGIDPTRVGGLFGLTEMGRIKVQLAAEAEADAAADAAAAASGSSVAVAAANATAQPAPSPAPAEAQPAAAQRTDQTVLTLAPDQGAEIKLDMDQGAKVRFAWSSSGGRINYDTHADRPGVRYHGYNKGSSERIAGELVAAFDGSHGWFWRNRTGEPVTITLQTTGAYSAIKRVV